MKVFKRDGPDSLRRALSLARDAFGDPGLDAPVIDGFGLLCHRYNGRLNDRNAIESLAKTHGGVNGVLGMAESLRHKTGNNKSHCVAAATVTILNRDLVGKAKLPSWWKE